MPVQLDRIGGHGDLLNARHLFDFPHQIVNIFGAQRFPAGQFYFSESEPRKDLHQPDHVLVMKDGVVGQFRNALLRHAVHASEVTAVRH